MYLSVRATNFNATTVTAFRTIISATVDLIAMTSATKFRAVSSSSNLSFLRGNLFRLIGPVQGSCDFESDFCGFVQDPANNENFTRTSGSTPSFGTGPNHDQSFNRSGDKDQSF